MSDFLKQLDKLSNERNDTAQLYADIDGFADRYHDEVASRLIEMLKRVIREKAQKGDFSYDSGKRVIKGTHKINFGKISEYCSIHTISERTIFLQKLNALSLPFSERLSFAGYPDFKVIDEVSSESTKKRTFFSRFGKPKKKMVCFSLPKGLAEIMIRFKEKALEDGIALSDLTYNYMFNHLNKETGKIEGTWVQGCSVVFPDCVSPVTYEWTACPSKYEYAVSFGSSITGNLEINYIVSY